MIEPNGSYGQDMELYFKNGEDRRSGIHRRQISHDSHIPERRSGKERRIS
jgi:hypothetical protein